MNLAASARAGRGAKVSPMTLVGGGCHRCALQAGPGRPRCASQPRNVAEGSKMNLATSARAGRGAKVSPMTLVGGGCHRCALQAGPGHAEMRVSAQEPQRI